MARTYNDIYYNDDENSTAEILDDMKKLAESVDQQIGSIKSFNNDTSQFIEQVTPLMNTLSEQVIDMHQLADTMFTELEQVKEENKQLRQDLNGLPKGQASGESIDLNDSAEMRCELKISGNSKQETRSGKNYLNMFTKYKAGDTTTINGIKFTFNKDGSITCDGTASADATLDFSIPDGGQKINGTDKKLVGLIGGEYSYTKAIACLVYDENWGNTKYINLVSANKNSTQVMADNIEYSRFRIIVYKDTVINNKTLYLQVLDTSQEDLSYEQYGLMPSPDYPSEVESCGDNGSINEVICNKNLVVEIQKGYWNNTGVFDSDNNFCSSKQIKVEPGKTYVCSLFDKNKKYVGKLVYTVFDKNKNFIRYSEEDTITIANNEKYVSLRTYTSQSSYVKNNNLLMQLEEGSTVTPYEEHKEQNFIMPCQKEMLEGDYFDTKNYKEVHGWKKLVLTSDENFAFVNTQTNTSRFDLAISNLMINTKCLCTHFKNVSVASDAEGIQIHGSAKKIIIWVSNNIATTTEQFKIWLQSQYNAGTPVKIYYKLETPELLDMTLEQKRVSDEIEKAKSYKGVTHMYSTDNVSPVIDVTYKKDIETLFANTLVEGV